MPEWPLEMLNARSLRTFVRPDVITLDVLRFGFEKGLLDEQDVVNIELERLKEGLALSEIEEQLAFLLSDDLPRVSVLLSESTAPHVGSQAGRIWAFTGASVLRLGWAGRPDAIYVLAGMIESLGFPEPYRELVYYEPSAKVPSRNRKTFMELLDDRVRDDGVAFGPPSQSTALGD